jgi:hypothetical protein
MRDEITQLRRNGHSLGVVFKERPATTILDTDTNGVGTSSRNPGHISNADWNEMCEVVIAHYHSHIPAEHEHLFSKVKPGDVAGMENAHYGPVFEDSGLFCDELQAEIVARPLDPRKDNMQITRWIHQEFTMFEQLQVIANSKGKEGEEPVRTRSEQKFVQGIINKLRPHVPSLARAWEHDWRNAKLLKEFTDRYDTNGWFKMTNPPKSTMTTIPPPRHQPLHRLSHQRDDNTGYGMAIEAAYSAYSLFEKKRK